MSLIRKPSLTLVTLLVVGFTLAGLPRILTAHADAPSTYAMTNLALFSNIPNPAPQIPTRHSNGKIAYETFHNGNTEIFVMNTDGSGQTQVTNTPGEEQQPVWAPDGNRIAFASTGAGGANLYDICVVNANGNGFTNLTNQLVDGTDPAWSPDGSKIAFSNSFENQSGVYVINADGTGMTNLTSDATRDENPLWSPDGSKIAFLSRRSGNFEIFIMNADGSGQTNLTNNSANDGSEGFVWSPDGAKIAFISRRNGGPDIYVMNADGSNVQRLTNTGDNLDIDWSPDGSKIVFTSGRDSVDPIPNFRIRGDIYVMNADGSGPARLTNDLNKDFTPKWSPDGNQIAWRYRQNQAPTGFNDDIVAISSLGGSLTNLTMTLSGEGNFSWGFTTAPVTPPGDTPAGSNVTVTENGVQLTFSNVTTAGETTVTPIDPNSLTGIPGEYLINANSLAFEIHTTAVYAGPITIGFQMSGVNNPATFSTLRVLHGEPPPNFVDRTILAPDSPSHDFATRTVYARVSSLSPFVVAELAPVDTTPPDIQITRPAADAVYLLNQAVTASYSCADTDSGVASCSGSVANGAVLNTSAVGSFSFTVNALDNAGNTATRTINYRVAYGINPLFDQTQAKKSGSTIPIKLGLANAAGVNQSAAEVVVTALGTTRISNNASGVLEDAGNSNPDFNFRYSAGSYIFNLKTSGYATGTYLLSFKAGNDPVTHTVQFQVK